MRASDARPRERTRETLAGRPLRTARLPPSWATPFNPTETKMNSNETAALRAEIEALATTLEVLAQAISLPPKKIAPGFESGLRYYLARAKPEPAKAIYRRLLRAMGRAS